MDYETAKKRLFSLINYEKVPKKGPKSLLNFLELLSYFHYPEENLENTIIVRGTKGKGSTSMILTQILTNNGYRTGLFTSPHLFSIRERISINLEYISQTNFAREISHIFKHIGNRRGIRTYFEVLTLLAIRYFLNQKTQYSVFEAGLGGRLDTTRLLEAETHILTDIGFDHVGILGNTLGDIAFEKMCGIDAGTLITLKQHPKVLKVVEEITEQRKIRLIREEKDFKIEKIDYYPDGTIIFLNTTDAGRIQLTIPLPGRFLVKSAVLACMTAITLGLERCDLGRLELPARFQKVHDFPVIIVDGSHNPMSLLNLKHELEFYFGHINGKKILVFAMMRDKHIRDSISILESFFDSFIFTEANVPRSEKKENLLKIFRNISSKPALLMSREKILDHIMAEGSLIVITGSFFIAGDILKNLLEKKMYTGNRLYYALD